MGDLVTRSRCAARTAVGWWPLIRLDVRRVLPVRVALLLLLLYWIPYFMVYRQGRKAVGKFFIFFLDFYHRFRLV